MYLEPKNRHLLVLPLNRDKEEKNSIILPDDYKQPKAPYITCDILGVAGDCSIDVSIGDLIVVESSMIHEIKAMGETNYLVLENYVYGRLQDE